MADGSPEVLAREASKKAALGIGLGGDDERLVLVLAACPGRPYLEARVTEARTMGHDAARIAARRPLRTLVEAAPGVYVS